MDDATAQKVKDLEASKARMIGHYLELQDRADELNGRIYRLCCDIETLNRQIALLHAQAPPQNGKAAVPPPAGSSRS